MWGFLWCLKQTCTPSHSCELSFGFTLLILTPAGLPAKKVQQQMLQFPSLLEAGVASGMSCCGKGGSLKRAFPHPIHELVFCSDFLSLPSIALCYISTLPQQITGFPKSSCPVCIALAPDPHCFPEFPHCFRPVVVSCHSPHSQIPPTSHSGLQHQCQVAPGCPI